MIYSWRNIWPKIAKSVFLAPSAEVIGDVHIGEESSLWFHTVVRGDVNSIRIGARTNVQDLSMLHVTRPKLGASKGGSPLTIGDDVTIGHHVMIHGCTIGNRVLVGMGAILLDNCVIGDDCMIGAGALVTQGFQAPSGSLIIGAPARIHRALKPEELAFLKQSAINYVGDSRAYIENFKA